MALAVRLGEQMTATATTAEREKRLVAFSSVLAAVFLTGMKLAVGLLTNSLGILSEAAHSGLDLVAAGVTYFAVRVSDRPPDREHPYGHGKVENLSALVETMLLLATCGWIVYEAIDRLISPVHVEASVWSFLAMGVSIVIDITRSRALMRMAVKHKSQALEADALHFSTDVWSSSVVIAGLVGVTAAQWLQAQGVAADWLFRADAVAALGVSGIVVYVSLRLGRRTVDALLDSTSAEMVEHMERLALQVPGVTAVRRLRLRQSGPAVFADITIAVPRSMSLEQARGVAGAVESTLQEAVPRSDVVVQIDPVVKDENSLVERVWNVAARRGVGVHAIRLHDVRGHLSLGLHLEVPDGLTTGAAHERATAFERALRAEAPEIAEIVTHIEPVGDDEVRRPASHERSQEVLDAVLALPLTVPAVRDCHHVAVHREGDELAVSFHCLVDPDLPVGRAHRLAVQLENALRARIPELGRVIIHVEPPEGDERREPPPS